MEKSWNCVFEFLWEPWKGKKYSAVPLKFTTPHYNTDIEYNTVILWLLIFLYHGILQRDDRKSHFPISTL